MPTRPPGCGHRRLVTLGHAHVDSDRGQARSTRPGLHRMPVTGRLDSGQPASHSVRFAISVRRADDTRRTRRPGRQARPPTGVREEPRIGTRRRRAATQRQGVGCQKECAAMAVVTMKELLASGVHFGHQTRRWNPKMKRFIFTERNGIYIIDLQQSLTYIDRAYEFVKETVAHGGSVLFIGTKKQAQEAVAEQATRVGMPYVNQRWLGGMLTNFSTVYKRLQRLKELRLRAGRHELRPAHQEGSPRPAAREGQAAEDPRWHPRDVARAERGLDRRHQEGAHRRRRGPQARYPGRRDPRHELRSGRSRLQDPRQRRRDPLGEPAHPGGRRRGGRRVSWPGLRLASATPSRTPTPAANSVAASRWPTGSASSWFATARQQRSRRQLTRR